MNDMKNVAKATQKNLKTEIDDLFKTFCERFLNKLFNTDNYKLGRAGYIFFKYFEPNPLQDDLRSIGKMVVLKSLHVTIY